MKLRLYHYWRSSSSWRVRWAFALKGIACEWVAVDLLGDAPESPDHRVRNPMGYVPVLEFLPSTGERPARFPFLAESVALIEWAEETQPSPALFPRDAAARARARQLVEIVNSGTQPLQNLNATERHSQDPDERKRWNQHWIRHGLAAYEQLVRDTAGTYSMGDALSAPDLFLVPQCFNAARNDVALEEFPTLKRIYEAALKTESCRASHPDRYKPSSS